MTIFEYAMYRYAWKLMNAGERQYAEVLAQQADAGDRGARQNFSDLTSAVLADAKNRRQRGNKKLQNGNKKF